jgi:hypothetical protein
MSIQGIVARLLLAAWLALSGLGAAAQTQPSGFTKTATSTAWTATSPDQGSGARVRLIYYPVESTSENFLEWFTARSSAKARTLGTITVTHGEPEQSYVQGKAPVLYVMYTVKNTAKKEFFVESYGYDTIEGLQLILVVSSISVPADNVAYRAAISALFTDWAAGGFYKPASTSTAPADTNIPPPPAGKKNCTREPVWGWAVRYGCSPSAVCNERVIKRYEWVCKG